MPSPADPELLEAWRGGDQQAGSELFERHFDRLARFFANKVAQGLDDLVQQTFLGCVEAKDRFRGDAAFRTFLLRIAHNVLCKHYRRKRVRGGVDFGVTAVADLGPSPTSIVARKAEERLLLEALRKIPFDYQCVLELSYWERLTAVEIAEVVGIPEGTAKTRLRRAKELLREAIGELSDDPAQLESTMGNLEGWAASVRELALPEES